MTPPDLDAERHPKTDGALAQRLRAVAPFILEVDLGDSDQDPWADAANSLDQLVESVAAHPSNDRIWLLFTAVCAAYPTRSEVDRIRRELELLDHTSAVVSLLDICLASASECGEPDSTVEMVVGGVVVDVDHSAKHDLHTGIQRVSRSLLPLWDSQHRIVVTAWTTRAGALRRLSEVELERILAWPTRVSLPTETVSVAETPPPLVIPWRCVVVMVEVPPTTVSARLAAVGNYSGNRLVGIAYDAIPIVSADMVPSEDSTKFVRYLTCLKFSSRMAGISRAATGEISGFVDALKTQGLPGPAVIEVPLASSSHVPVGVGKATSRPTILVVGSHEPRKNHLAILHSAEILWRGGLEFELSFIGGSGWGEDFPRRIAQLRATGRPIQVRRAVSESELERSYAAASFTVFPSLHEGYGLPVVESLAHGVPVITSNFGSTAQVGADGGTLMIDPRDGKALTAAMRTLLTDPAVLQRLRDEIRARPERTWQDYADDLWHLLVEPDLGLLNGYSENVDQVHR